MQSDNPFDQSMNCFTKAERVTSESNCSVNYMLIRALSMHPHGYYAANQANKTANGCPKWATRMLCHVLTPRKNVRRWGYIKKPKSTLTETQKRHILLICKQFNISPEHGEETYKLLIEQGLDMKEIFGQKALDTSKQKA